MIRHLGLLFLLIIATPVILQAQCINKNITTNPDSPLNNEKPTKTNTFFDWRSQFFQANSARIPATQVYSPFYQYDNGMVAHFFENKDMQPEDGWELIAFDFGFLEDGTPRNPPTDYVHLILYNKYTGILRAFFAGDSPQAFNGARILLRFNDSSSGVASSVLSNASQLFPLDYFEQNPRMVALSEYNNGLAKWFYADFQMAYDPCTCFYESTFSISVELINSATIELSGAFQGTLASIQNNTGSVYENGFSIKDIVSAGQKAHKSYQTFSKFVKDQEKALQIDGKANWELTVEQLIKRNTLNSFQQTYKSSSFLKAGVKSLPYLGIAVELVDFFVGGGKKSAGPQEVKIMPMAVNAAINLKGNLSAEYLYKDVNFYTPGSKDSHIKQDEWYPYYNEVLGVFNLLHTPVVKYFEDVWSYHDPYTDYYEEYSYQKYQLDINSIKYILNQAAGFDPNDIEIYWTLGPNGRTEHMVPITTNYVLEGGFYQYYFGQGSPYHESHGCISSFTPHYIKLFINLKRQDADANTQNVLLVMKYPITLDFDPGFSFSSNNYCDVSDEKIFTNTTISSSVKVWDKMIIDEGTTFSTLSSIELIAGNEVVIKPGVIVPPNVTIKVGEPLPGSTYLPPASPSYVSSFCTTGAYNPTVRAYRVNHEEEMLFNVEEADDGFNLTAYPNPTNSAVTFQYTLAEPTEIYFVFMDLNGRVVQKLDSGFKSQGRHEVIYDTQTLPSGIYLYRLQTGKINETKRLVVIK